MLKSVCVCLCKKINRIFKEKVATFTWEDEGNPVETAASACPSPWWVDTAPASASGMDVSRTCTLSPSAWGLSASTTNPTAQAVPQRSLGFRDQRHAVHENLFQTQTYWLLGYRGNEDMNKTFGAPSLFLSLGFPSWVSWIPLSWCKDHLPSKFSEATSLAR